MIKNQDPTVKIAWSSCAYAYNIYVTMYQH